MDKIKENKLGYNMEKGGKNKIGKYVNKLMYARIG